MLADIVVCGEGIAGISTAYHLAVRYGLKNVLLIDDQPPLSVTSDKSTECYRNWWPGPGNAMVALMNRSIDLMETLAVETENLFHLNRRGYLFLSASPNAVSKIERSASQISRLGAGPLRIHRGLGEDPEYITHSNNDFSNQPDGADLILDQSLIHRHFPYLSPDICAALHVRRAGWFSAQQMGMYLLEQAQARGVNLVQGRISEVEISKNKISALRLASGDKILTNCLVNATGPFLKQFGRLLDIDLPVFCEPHEKVFFPDIYGTVDRNAPLLIWVDDQFLDWNDEEKEILQESDLTWLLDKLPSGVHVRPEGGPESKMLLMLWEYQSHSAQPIWPMASDPQYPEVVLRGLTRMIPGMKAYLGKAPRPRIDGGYYTKTIDNRPIIGKLPVEGAYIIGALSGFGLMSACGAGELIAETIVGDTLPDYAPAFSLQRFFDPDYQKILENWDNTWQL